MERHKQIRIEQSYIRTKLEQNDIEIEDFYLKMKNFNKELLKVEKKMYEEHLSIKKDFIQFNEQMIPISYLKISKRFPHLNLEEIICFDKKIKEKGGNIRVHSGIFRLLNRACKNRNIGIVKCFVNEEDLFIGWDCCPGRGSIKQCCRFYNSVDKPTSNKCNGDLRNRCPSSGNSETFYLNDEDEKINDIKKVTLSNVILTITNNIKILEELINENSNKILKLRSLKETINLLINT